jgi:hypothetical protein
MAEIAGIASAVTAAASGGLVGILGSGLGRVFGLVERRMARKDKELEFEQERYRWQHESQLVRLQMDAKQAETEQAIELAASEGSWAGLRASIDADAKIDSSSPWVNDIRGITRPALTVLLWVITGAILWFGLADKSTTQKIVDAIVFSATTATVWWFGDRAPGRAKG